jgi:hypothetical protein
MELVFLVEQTEQALVIIPQHGIWQMEMAVVAEQVVAILAVVAVEVMQLQEE